MNVEVFEDQGTQPGDVGVEDGMTLGPELVEGGVHVAGVKQGDRVENQAEGCQARILCGVVSRLGFQRSLQHLTLFRSCSAGIEGPSAAGSRCFRWLSIIAMPRVSSCAVGGQEL